MPVVLSFLDRVRLLKFDQGPVPLLDLVSSGVSTGIATALDLGVFKALHEQPSPAGKLAERLDVDPDGLLVLLDFLETGGYVEQEGGRFQLTKLSEEWIQPDAPKSLAPTVQFWEKVMLPFIRGNLHDAIRHGDPDTRIHEWIDEDAQRRRIARDFHEELSRRVNPNLVGAVELPQGAKRMLTVGVQWAYYPLEFHRAYPNLAIDVVDYPAPLAPFADIVGDAGSLERLELREGDYLQDPLGDAYHVIVVGDALSRHGAEDARRLLHRAAQTLQPGGRLVLVDRFDGIGRTQADDAMLSLVNLMFRATYGGRVHSQGDVVRWVEQAGLQVRSTRSVQGTLGLGVVVADKLTP